LKSVGAGAQGAIGQDLRTFLEAHRDGGAPHEAAADVVLALANAATRISALLRRGPIEGLLGNATGSVNVDGDSQRKLDVIANDEIADALRAAPVAYLASEEEEAILTLSSGGSVAVAVDPLDGSSNIDANVSVGTIFSIFPVSLAGATASFFRPGAEQIAAGYFVYGPHTSLALSMGHGVDLFALDPRTETFRLVRRQLAIPRSTTEFAINASNYRHWLEPIRTFVDDCYAGAEGPRGKDFNMRWIASLVAETHRIFSRGGVFLYPADRRAGYEKGRLRLIYEAAPIAMLAEQAGGGAIDGLARILDKVPKSLHERTPLIFGSAEKIERILNYHNDPAFLRNQAPLFGERGLFRA
jgi:fructose-1,6-bisphosphatase I